MFIERILPILKQLDFIIVDIFEMLQVLVFVPKCLYFLFFHVDHRLFLFQLTLFNTIMINNKTIKQKYHMQILFHLFKLKKLYLKTNFIRAACSIFTSI